MENKLTMVGVIQSGIQIGLKNLVAVIVNVILWALTLWIPYINVGTTIGLVGLVTKMGRSEGLSMTEVFNPNYRNYMGEFFLVAIFVGLGIELGMLFLVIPGIAIAVAWSLAIYLVIDKGLDPMEAIKKSNELTKGNRWAIFLGPFILGLVLMIVAGILGMIPAIGSLLTLVVVILASPILMGANAYIYETLTKDRV